MKKTLLYLATFLFVSTVYSQIGYKPVESPSRFEPYKIDNSTYNSLYNALQQKQAQYDQNQNYLYSLLEWCLKLTSQVNELDFQNGVNYYYKQLKNLEDSDLSIAGTTLKKIENSIKEEIASYENRFKENNNAEKFWKEGLGYFEKQQFAYAISKFSKVIELSQLYAPAYFYRALCYQRENQLASAVEDLNSALKHDPTIAKDIYNVRGWVYDAKGEYYLSLQDFNMQVAVDPTNPTAYYNRGHAKSALKDYLGAIVDYKKAIELNPDFSMAYNNIAWAKFLQKKYSEALIDANKAIELDPKNYVAWDTRAEIKLNLKNYNGCVSDCNKALELNPKLSNSYLLRGKAKIALLKKTEGCLDLSKAGELGSEAAYETISKNCN